MGNTKPIGVAYSDPDLDSAQVTGAVTAGSVSSSGAVTSTGVTTASSFLATVSSGLVARNSNAGFYILSTAITANTTTTTAPAGSLGITTNATGLGKLFYSDGTKWQFMAIT